jgi:hypothetical protein
MNTHRIAPRTLLLVILGIVVVLVALWRLLPLWMNGSSMVKPVPDSQLTSYDSPSQPGTIESEYRPLPFDTTVHVDVGNHIPEFALHLRVALDSTKYEEILVYDIRIGRAGDSTTMHIIRDTSRTEMATGLELVDINFDGFLDLQIVSNLDAVGNRSYHFWTFDSASASFRFNSEFSEALGGGMVVTPANRQISLGYRVGMGGSAYTYEVIKGHLKLIEQTSEEEVVVDDTVKTKTTIQKLVGDSMKVVSEEYNIR